MELNTAQPLVSIVVITYNSAKYVLETLESAKNQTYKNIELIISDDCSKDDTVAICENWLAKNQDRFIRTELITVDKNSGIAPNFNRGVRVARGEWIKGVAGDDILLENCIFDNVHYVTVVNHDAQIVFSKMVAIDPDSCYIKDIAVSPFFSLKTAKEQYAYLLNGYCGGTPSSFFSKSLFNNVGGFDERYPFIEDYPFILKCVKENIFVNFVDITTVKYRVGDGIYTSNARICSPLYLDSWWNFLKCEIFKNRACKMWFLTWSQLLYYFKCNIGIHLFNNRCRIEYKLFHYLLYIFDPIIWIRKLKSMF